MCLTQIEFRVVCVCVCDITEVINETLVPTSSLPPPSRSLILFLCCLTPLQRFFQCRLCFLSAVGGCSVILWTFQLSHPLLHRRAFQLSFPYICFLISPLLSLWLLRSAVSVYLLVPGVVWTGQGCALRGRLKTRAIW